MAGLNNVCKGEKSFSLFLYLLCARHCFRCFLSIILLNPDNKPYGVCCSILSTSQRIKLKHRGWGLLAHFKFWLLESYAVTHFKCCKTSPSLENTNRKSFLVSRSELRDIYCTLSWEGQFSNKSSRLGRKILTYISHPAPPHLHPPFLGACNLLGPC